MKRLRRSMVIIPGNVPQFLEKCRSMEADVLVFDLQDAIAKVDAAKREARQLVIRTLADRSFKAREICVRVNSPGSPWMADDIKGVVDAGVDSIMVSHGYGAGDLAYAEGCIHSAGASRPVESIVEVDTPAMLADLDAIARTATTVTGLAVAAYDFALEMGAQLFGPHASPSEDWLEDCRSRLLMVARWKGWNATDLVSVNNLAGPDMEPAMRRSRGLGFDGVTLLYPRLVPMANEIFGVSPEEFAWARALVDGWRQQDGGPDWNKGARKVGGALVLSPTYEYACRVLLHRAVIDGDLEATQRFRSEGLASHEYLVEKRIR